MLSKVPAPLMLVIAGAPIREVERAWTGSSIGRSCQTFLTLLTLFFSPGRLQTLHKPALVESANRDQDSFIRSGRSIRSNV